MNLPVLDPIVVAGLRELNQPGEPDVVHEILTLFLADAPVRFAAIDAAVAAGDGPSLQRAAHALKGSASTIGAHALQRTCQNLEEIGKSGDLDGAHAAIDLMQHEYARLHVEINQLL